MAEDDVVAAARAGDRSAFAVLVRRHQRELRVHCYRMLGSFDESEDLVRETFVRAWKNLPGFDGRSSMRAWLYRLATSACFDFIDGRARRVLPHEVSPPSEPWDARPPQTDIAWLQPFPDQLWEPAEPGEDEPDAAAVTRETIELTFLTAIQHLPPRQRAVLILRDVLGWTAKQTAVIVNGTVASVNSASQRARATVRELLPIRRPGRAADAEPTEQELLVLRHYMDAIERADLDAMAGLMAEDIRVTMPPYPMWFQGRDTVVGALAAGWDVDSSAYLGTLRLIETQANRQPAAAAYVRSPGDSEYRALAISALRIEDGRIVEMTAFHDTALFTAFELPETYRALN